MLGKAAVPFQVVLTKTDLVSARRARGAHRRAGDAARQDRGAMPHPIATSSRSQEGLELLRAALAKLARPQIEAPR